jgi:hypothetical protein
LCFDQQILSAEFQGYGRLKLDLVIAKRAIDTGKYGTFEPSGRLITFPVFLAKGLDSHLIIARMRGASAIHKLLRIMRASPDHVAAVSFRRVARFAGALAVAGSLVICASAQAQSISGTIQFTGGAQLDNANLAAATRFISIFGPSGPGSNPQVLAATETGNYVGIPNGTPAVFTPFTFVPPAANVIPLWTLTIGATTYSFDATSVQVVYQDSFFLDIGGQGVAHITGMQDTVGTWSITDTGGDGSVPVFTFGAATDVGSVGAPEPSTFALLVILVLPFIWRFVLRPGGNRLAKQEVTQTQTTPSSRNPS